MIKIVSFFEEHIEKVILAIVGIAFLVLFYFFVFPGSNRFLYDNKKFSPGTIDRYISKQAELLKQTTAQPPAPPKPYEPNLPKFAALLDSAVRTVDTRIYPPQPYTGSIRPVGIEKAYKLPTIGEVNEPVVEHIRAVAYVPVEEITAEVSYDNAKNEPNDIDLVTVESSFDIAELYRRFQESFLGDDIPAAQRDPCLAKPVFAAVQLQRREALADGGWSGWQTVPRLKIDPLKNLLATTENIERLPRGGLRIRLLQFDNRQVMMNLLQPMAYQIASAKEEWFPPSLHKKFAKLQKEQQLEEKRKILEEEKAAREKEQEERRAKTQEARQGSGTSIYGEGLRGTDTSGVRDTRLKRSRSDRLSETTPGGVGDSTRLRDSSRLRDTGRTDTGRRTDTSRLTDTTRPLRRGERQENIELERRPLAGGPDAFTRAPIDEVSIELNRILITDRSDFTRSLPGRRSEQVFWAHDETVEPKKTYQYRIRLGVFNPVAVTEQSSSQDRTQAKDAILWSEFSSPTEPIQIPGTLYLFAKDLQEAAKIVTVTVSKYIMGRWHSQDFPVRQGEAIGRAVEEPIPQAEPTASAAVLRSQEAGGYRTPQTRPSILPGPGLPEIIDYSTGAVLIDVVAVNDWSSGKNMLPRHYFDMLYSFDGTDIERAPINTKYWATDLRTAYVEIQNLQKQPPEPLRPWGTGTPGYRTGYMEAAPGTLRRRPGSPDDSLREEIIMEEMRRREMRR